MNSRDACEVWSWRLAPALAALMQSFALGGAGVPPADQGYAGLSGFGEPVEILVERTNPGAPGPGGSTPPPPYTTVQRLAYGYDLRGNRRWAEVDQVGSSNQRSYAYGYDRLQRLISADMGVLTLQPGEGGTGFQPVIAPPSGRLGRSVDWALDHLGNWFGNSLQAIGFNRTDYPPAGGSVAFTADHQTDRGNQINQIAYTSGVPPPNSTQVFVHDAAGNLVFDGHYVYLYDGFNRLVRVLRGGQLNSNPAQYFEAAATGNPPTPNPNAGRPNAPAGLLNAAEHLVADFSYDGFGRLISKRFFAGRQENHPAPGQHTRYYAEAHYYYDGARRIQEVYTYDAATAAFLWPLEADLPPCVENPGAPGGTGILPVEGCTRYAVEHEYVYGPDYIDEPIALVTPDDLYGLDNDGDVHDGTHGPLGTPVRFSGEDDVYYFVQDANYNVMSLTDAAGAVLVQYQYDPYGTLAIRDPLVFTTPQPPQQPQVDESAIPDNAIGHQGLFLERFYTEDEIASDSRILTTATSDGPATAGSSSEPAGLYYVRNRWYSPVLGRFTSADPNGMGVPAAQGAIRGSSLESPKPLVSIAVQLADTLNLYQAFASAPVGGTDPLGLFTLIELGGASSFAVDRDLDTLDVGMSLLEGVRGLADAVETRNQLLGALGVVSGMGPNMAGIDRALAVYDTYQQGQSALFAAGVLKGGFRFASGGISSVLRLSRGQHGIPKFLGGNRAQYMYEVPWPQHRQFDTELNRVLKDHGFPDRNAAGYKDYLRRTGRQGEAFQILESFAKNFDRRYKTRFADAYFVNFLGGNSFLTRGLMPCHREKLLGMH